MNKRYFNTSGPNIPEKHYTLLRDKLIEKGLDFEEINDVTVRTYIVFYDEDKDF